LAEDEMNDKWGLWKLVGSKVEVKLTKAENFL